MGVQIESSESNFVVTLRKSKKFENQHHESRKFPYDHSHERSVVFPLSIQTINFDQICDLWKLHQLTNQIVDQSVRNDVRWPVRLVLVSQVRPTLRRNFLKHFVPQDYSWTSN
jgi:hypothetical protein